MSTYLKKSNLLILWVGLALHAPFLAASSENLVDDERAERYKTAPIADIQRMISEKPEDLRSFDLLGSNPILRICERTDVPEDDIVAFFNDCVIKHSIALNTPHQKTHKTALHISAAHSRKKVVDWLLEKGLDVNAAAIDGTTPLISAVSFSGNLEIIQALVGHGANVNQPTHIVTPFNVADDPSYIGGQIAPIHWAVQSGFEEYIRFLLENKANVFATTETGKDVFHFLQIALDFKNIGQSEYDRILLLLNSYVEQSKSI